MTFAYSVLLCLSVCLVTFLPYAQTGADTRVRMYTACSFVTHQHTLLRMKTVQEQNNKRNKDDRMWIKQAT